jgi:hypothetical protein
VTIILDVRLAVENGTARGRTLSAVERFPAIAGRVERLKSVRLGYGRDDRPVW